MTTTDGGPVRILVTGSRYLDQAGSEFVYAVLGDLLAEVDTKAEPGRSIVLVHGAARGVDTCAQVFANAYALGNFAISHEPHPPDWRRGKQGGPQRNAVMVALGAHLCLAFPRRDSVGTWGCIRLAANAGIPVRVHPLPRMSGDS